jgi:hypothetical protein
VPVDPTDVEGVVEEEIHNLEGVLRQLQKAA